MIFGGDPSNNNGWTCRHVAASDGPCVDCRPATGLCRYCQQPIDDHEKVGTPTMSCRRKRQAA